MNPGLKNSGTKVRRSEFEDSTFRSLGREENRLNRALEEYDKARKVVRRELAHDERLALKASNVPKFPQSVVKIYSLHPRPGSGVIRLDTVVHNDNFQTYENGSSNSNPSNKFPGKLYRSKTARVTSSTRIRRSSVHGKDCDKLQESCSQSQRNYPAGEKYHAESVISLKECCEPRKQPGRNLFDYLSVPKNRSNVMGIRERLRQEFEHPRPGTAIGTSNRPINFPDGIGMIRGRALRRDVSTLPKSIKFQETRLKDVWSPSHMANCSTLHESLSPLDNDYQLSPEGVHALLNIPAPVVVTGSHRCCTSLPD